MVEHKASHPLVMPKVLQELVQCQAPLYYPKIHQNMRSNFLQPWENDGRRTIKLFPVFFQILFLNFELYFLFRILWDAIVT